MTANALVFEYIGMSLHEFTYMFCVDTQPIKQQISLYIRVRLQLSERCFTVIA